MKLQTVLSLWIVFEMFCISCFLVSAATTAVYVKETTTEVVDTTILNLEETTTGHVTTINEQYESNNDTESEIFESTTVNDEVEATTFKLTTTKKPSKKKTYFPHDVKVCSAKDPDLETCFKEAANKMIKHIRPGIRRLGILPMDPLRVPLVALPRNNHLLPSLSFNATDTEQHGWPNAVVTDARLDLENLSLHAEFYFPRYRLRGHYSVEGELLDFIPLEGEGDFDIKIDDSRFAVSIHGHLLERRSKRYIQIDGLSIETNFGRMHVYLTNLFGDEQLSDLTNALINQNSDLVVERAGPAIESVSAELYRGLLQRFFDAVPWDNLFNDLPEYTTR